MKKHFFYHLLFLFFATIFSFNLFSQAVAKTFPAKRTSAIFKIDGKLEEAAWKDAVPATDFVEWRPNFGAIEENATRTEIYLLYDNTAIYVGGYCHEKSKDSVSKELVGRDRIGVNDYVGVIFDTYFDKINGVGFYITPLGEQYDAKYSTTSGEDDSWNAVWDAEAEVVADGWTFEMKIPYSALRFVSKDNQTWGLNITRNRKKVGRQFMWNPVDPKVNGFINQEGSWTGIEKIDAPVRLSFSPYFSTYLNHFRAKIDGVKDWTSSINGGMDLKYGINDAFTLDMTLVPDFGQVQSDNQVLNLSPFEVRYNENRSFFTEGTELFSKGNLFYSRRIGGTPIHSGDIYNNLGVDDVVLKNPSESKLINATKISGRTKKGFGLGVFNAITKTMYATIENSGTKETRKLETNPLTNYSIIVFDQSLKNNSSISFINTNTLRNGKDYDANVSAALFDFNNKKNTYNFNGKVAVSQLIYPGKNTNGYSHNFSLRKTGKWNFQIGEELADEKYDINDMGILYNNNYIDHFLWTAYRWLKPTKWYNRIQVNYNAYYSLLYKNLPGQKVTTRFQTFSTNVNGNMQLKNLWFVGMYFGYAPKGNDFYEPRTTGYSFKTPRRIQFNPWFETNSTKKYYANFGYFVGLRSLFNSPNHQIYISQRYRFNDRFSISHDISYNPAKNDAGFYDKYYKRDANGNLLLD
ncbi:MAG: carbohydrate binding family 9 domain-containing protein, partial [Bacteroidia bacterium]|nr:carbohydrate binding family 9 domain-containing protein [Bacteroidia bacterium]